MKEIKIGIVDDSPFQIAILTEILTEKGFKVVGDAGSLQETIEMVKEKRPELVTMDMTIPGTDGLECTRAIHAVDPNIKVVIVSSMMDDEIVKQAKFNKAAGYIQKPVDPDEIATVIERIMASEELLIHLDKEYFTIFKEAFSDNVNRVTKTPVSSYYNETKQNESQTSRGISIVIGIIGKFTGRMIIDVSYETAEAMTAAVMKRPIKNEEEPYAVIGEFANIVAGNACSMLNRKNKAFGFRVAPPTIFHGTSLHISKTMLDTTSIIAQTVFGEMYLDVGFKRGEEEWM